LGIADGIKPTGLAAAIVYLASIVKGQAYYFAESIAKMSNLSQPSMYALYKFVKMALRL
jgi:transcription initiation factor TFIIIB Brf1 subunit/transcription initiation factor TFIIB